MKDLKNTALLSHVCAFVLFFSFISWTDDDALISEGCLGGFWEMPEGYLGDV